jgi:uncharacterized RDD family membrane protein YckC
MDGPACAVRSCGSEICVVGVAGVSAVAETGPGSVARFGSRFNAFVVDAVLAIVVAIISGHRPPSAGYNLVVYVAFLAIELLFVMVAGQTPGMRAAGIAVVRASDGGRPRPGWVLLRTVLLATLLPALLVDSSGRALHDRAAGTAMLRTR